MNESQLRVAAPATAFLTRRTPLHVTRGLETSALIAVLLLLAGCTGTGITGSTYQSHSFTIIATTGYTGALVEDSGTTLIPGAPTSHPVTASSAGTNTPLTVWKTAADGQPLTVEADGRRDGERRRDLGRRGEPDDNRARMSPCGWGWRSRAALAAPKDAATERGPRLTAAAQRPGMQFSLA